MATRVEPLLAFASPPVWEVGLSVMTAPAEMYSDYDVRGLHDHFRTQFPVGEKQPNLTMLQPFPGPSTGGMAQEELALQFVPDYRRWWFLSEDAHDLLQVQENFIGRNWRRLVPPGIGDVAYPGYDAIRDDFKALIEKLREVHVGDNHPFPEPTLCDLHYDNFIPLEDDDGPLRFSEAIVPVTFSLEPAVPLLGLTMNWFERLDAAPSVPEGEGMDLRVVIASVVLPGPERPLGYARLTLNARGVGRTWEEAFDFFDRAHLRIRERLMALTTDRCRVRWRQL